MKKTVAARSDSSTEILSSVLDTHLEVLDTLSSVLDTPVSVLDTRTGVMDPPPNPKPGAFHEEDGRGALHGRNGTGP